MKSWKFGLVLSALTSLIALIVFGGIGANVGDLVYLAGSAEQTDRILIGNTFTLEVHNPTGTVFKGVTFFIDFKCVDDGRMDNYRGIIVTDIDKQEVTRLLTINIASGEYDERHNEIVPLLKNMNAGAMCAISVWPKDDEISYMVESWIWFPATEGDSP